MWDVETPNPKVAKGRTQCPCLQNVFEMWLLGERGVDISWLKVPLIGKGDTVPLV